VISKVKDPIAQQIHRENADRMCLASFVSGLSGVVSRQVRYAHPRNLQEILNSALAVDEAEKQERRNETFTRGQTSVQASYLGQQARAITEETVRNEQLTHVRRVSRF